MLGDKIRQSIIEFRDKLLDSPFKGIDDRTEPVQYNQKWLEDHVHTRPKGDKYDYCYVWCLCFAYANLISTRPWEDIATALAQVSEEYFDHVGGSVHDTAKLTKELGKLLKVPYYIDRVQSFDGDHNKELIQKVNEFRLKKKLGVDYFLMSAYEPQHYMFVSHSGIEVNPFPGYQGKFVGLRIYQAIKMGL